MVELLNLSVVCATVYFTWLKVTGQIVCSWWWVLSPLWIYLLLIIIVGVLLYLLSSLGEE